MKHFSPASKPKALLLDLDGTVYAGNHEIPGASAFIHSCRSVGIRCIFVTNRSNRTPEEVRDQLNSYGIECSADDVVTTSLATARFLKSGSAFIIGENGLKTALEAQGLVITPDSPDYVVVSIDRQFSYDKLKLACQLLQNGAKFIATNMDPRLKIEGTTVPGTGSIVAAVMTASGLVPVVIGKPERHTMDMALEKCQCQRSEALVIGDNLDTDIAAGINAGIETVLILTGVHTRADIATSPFKPTYVAEDFAELSAAFF